jgi:hypothetical protein
LVRVVQLPVETEQQQAQVVRVETQHLIHTKEVQPLLQHSAV